MGSVRGCGGRPGDAAGPVGVYVATGGVVSSYLVDRLSRSSDLPGATGGVAHIGNDKDFPSTRISYKLNLTGPSLNVQTACSSRWWPSTRRARASRGSATWRSPAGSTCASPLLMHIPSRSSARCPGRAAPVLLRRRDGTSSARAAASSCSSAVGGGGTGPRSGRRPRRRGQPGRPQRRLSPRPAAPRSETSSAARWPPPRCGPSRSATSRPTAPAPASATPSRPRRSPTSTAATRRPGLPRRGQDQHRPSGAAAGVAGLIKAALCLSHAEIPPQPALRPAQSKIYFDGAPFSSAPPAALAARRGPRLAAANSLGLGGTNAFVVLEGAPSREAESGSRRRRSCPSPSRANPGRRCGLDGKAPRRAWSNSWAPRAGSVVRPDQRPDPLLQSRLRSGRFARRPGRRAGA